jgi:hypothetical protein
MTSRQLNITLEVDEKTEKVCMFNEKIIVDKSKELEISDSAFFGFLEQLILIMKIMDITFSLSRVARSN